jgi:hypothetical protein
VAREGLQQADLERELPERVFVSSSQRDEPGLWLWRSGPHTGIDARKPQEFGFCTGVFLSRVERVLNEAEAQRSEARRVG